ncbi:PHD finger protein ALFIN-LIKE 3-like [Lolium rigidum]|uniref:PHD finger protein ALFIN-LIKE 3-like n=1 Tax=Lolium rigidum TaxID=89674 RepID=UPI001F5CF9BF|nr:PHD finger protein ALFIN-LIKE 3-like [Lolium rigidum]
MATSQLAASSSKPKITRPLTMDAMIQDISSRRDALVRALTTDQEEFFRLCDPAAGRKPLLLYGHADGSWEVTGPEEDAPPDMPEPAAGLNLVRDDMTRFDWLSRVAVRADAWLAGLTQYFGATLNANQKMHLFDMLIDLPTVYETFEKCYKDDSVLLPTNMPPSSDLGQNVSNPNKDSTIPAEENVPLGPGLMQNVSNPKSGSWTHDEDSDEELEVSDQTFCGACGAPYHANGFWIGCDFCDRWFHGKCVKIKASEAQHICQYKCPDCMQNEIGE